MTLRSLMLGLLSERFNCSKLTRLFRYGSPSSVIAAWLAAAWVIGFCVYFFSSVLPNSQPRISRLYLLALLPDYFLDYLTAEPTRGAPASGWSAEAKAQTSSSSSGVKAVA